MGSLLFSMKGRINSAEFLKGAIILITINVILSALSHFMAGLMVWFVLVSIILIWPWLAIWVKRFHDGGRSGWMVLVAILVWAVVGWAFSLIVNMVIPIDKTVIEAAAASGDIGEIIRVSIESVKPQFFLRLIFSVVGSLIVVLLFNAIIKSDPEENQFGEPTT